MPIPFFMPKFDMDQEKAIIASWEKHEGDLVQADEPVLTVETDKVAIEVPAPATGRLAGIRFKPGDVVPVATVIAYILKEGESLPEAEVPAGPAAQPAAAQPATAAPAGPTAAPAPGVNASPVAQRAAQALGVDLAQVPAVNGRITRQAVERYAASQSAPSPAAAASPVESQAAQPPATGPARVAATPAARRAARELDVALAGVAGSGPRGRVQAADVAAFAAAQAPAAQLGAQPGATQRPAQAVPLAGMRRTIAERMAASFHDSPHIALTVNADATAIEACRARLNALAAREGRAKVSLTALLVKICAWALRRHPYLNASLVQDTIYLWDDVNVGVATALPDGLIVPVVHQADTRPVGELAEALRDLTTRAQAGLLALRDVQQGTFTISNLGMFGIHQFRAIINPPESAILAVGAVVRQPVVINDRDEVAVRPRLALTLSADHRVVDGVTAARFLGDIVQAIESPDTLLY